MAKAILDPDKKKINSLLSDIIQDINKIQINLNSTFTVPDPSKKNPPIIDVPLYMYIFWFYSAFERLESTVQLLQEQVLYHITGTTDLCTGTVNIDQNEDNIYKVLTKNNGKFNVPPRTHKDNEKSNKFLNEFISRTINSKCSFSSTGLGLYYEGMGHKNMLLAFKDTKKKKIVLSLYEPHGYGVKDNISAVSDTFLNYLYTSRPDLFKIAPRTSMSCYKGAQAYTGDPFGFCVMFSYFWLYCILKIAKKHPITFREIKYIEKSLIQHLKPDELFTIVLKFSVEYTKSCLNILYELENGKYRVPFEQDVYNNVKKEFAKQYSKNPSFDPKKSIVSLNIPLHKKIIDYIQGWIPKPLDPEISAEDRKEQEEHLEKVQNMGNIKSLKIVDGFPCKQSTDCESNKCVSKKTKQKTAKGKVENGIVKVCGSEKNADMEPCEKDDECLSDNCKNKICTPYYMDNN
jgi:hypothetical protein